MTNRLYLPPGSRLLFNLACLVLVVLGLRAAAAILVPFALALFLTMLSLPLLLRLQARRIPSAVAVLLTVLVNVAVLGLFLLIVSQSANEIRLAVPRYLQQLQTLVLSTQAWLVERRVPVEELVLIDLLNPEYIIGLVTGTLRGIAWAVSNALLVLIIMIFMLAETAVFPDKLRAALGSRDADLGRFAKITLEVQHYLGIKTVISMITGTLVGMWVWFLGIDFPLFWGFMAFLFNYIPSIGSILASIPPILLGLLQYGVGTALLVTLGFLVVNVTLGNIIEPNLLGRRLGLSTLVVILSLVFWGWVWGPVGMLLSLPMTMIVKIMLENTSDMRWIAILLGPRAPRPRTADAASGLPQAEPVARRGPPPDVPSPQGR
ncbi:MAG TPA: AI-2E family transporter [Longimicrobiaceae bacterium]|nr:AI-2E family transporter [Longimicrobiaceae bacterium]